MLIKGDGAGIEATAGRLQLVLVSEPMYGGEGGSFTSRQSTVSGDLEGPSRRESNKAEVVYTQCLPEGSC
jgi:hypothetical protein